MLLRILDLSRPRREEVGVAFVATHMNDQYARRHQLRPIGLLGQATKRLTERSVIYGMNYSNQGCWPRHDRVVLFLFSTDPSEKSFDTPTP